MTDRDTPAANSPEPDDVPREPSGAEIDDAMRANGRSNDADPIEPDTGDDADVRGNLDEFNNRDDDGFPAAPEVSGAAPARVTYPPSKPAVIAGAILSALMLGLMILAWTQEPKSYMPDINHQQIEGVARVLEDQDVADYTSDEVKAAQEAFANGGSGRDMTGETAAQALNTAKPDSVTAAEIDDVLSEAQASFQTLEGLESGLRSQIILFAVTGALMALGTVLYQRGKVWARYIGMFVSGFVAVMYIMQVLQGALNIPGIIIVVASVAAFYFFMKGRLDEAPAARAGGGAGRAGGGLGSLFAPRPRRPKASE